MNVTSASWIDEKQKEEALAESEPLFKDADFPELYLQVTPDGETGTWYSLNLNQGLVLMGWQSRFYKQIALSLKSEIFLLGGIHREFEGACAYVHRFDTARPPSSGEFTLSESIPTMPSTLCNCAALSDKIYVFNSLNRLEIQNFVLQNLSRNVPIKIRYEREEYESVLEVFDPISNLWQSFTEKDVNLPDTLKGIDPERPVLSDSPNKRILLYYPSEGLYAFSPDTSEWKPLSQKLIPNWAADFRFSAVINGVLYSCQFSRDIRQAVKAFDLADNVSLLRMVWPRQDKYYFRFNHEIQWMSPIDLGKGMLCLLGEVIEDDEPSDLRKSYSHFDPDPDLEHYYYSSSEDDLAPSDKTSGQKSDIRHVLTGMILEVEKKPGSKGKMKLRVKKAIRVRYEFDNLHLSCGILPIVSNMVSIARPSSELGGAAAHSLSTV